MCGGASKLLIAEHFDAPSDVINICQRNGLRTGQDLIDEGAAGLQVIGLSETDIAFLGDRLDREVGQRIE
jgi:hypothetical protein